MYTNIIQNLKILKFKFKACIRTHGERERERERDLYIQFELKPIGGNVLYSQKLMTDDLTDGCEPTVNVLFVLAVGSGMPYFKTCSAI
jgi:hypothetical protein